MEGLFNVLLRKQVPESPISDTLKIANPWTLQWTVHGAFKLERAFVYRDARWLLRCSKQPDDDHPYISHVEVCKAPIAFAARSDSSGFRRVYMRRYISLRVYIPPHDRGTSEEQIRLRRQSKVERIQETLTTRDGSWSSYRQKRSASSEQSGGCFDSRTWCSHMLWEMCFALHFRPHWR